MAYQTVTTTSYGNRLKNAFKGVGTGFLMLIAGVVLLFWNEGRTVKTTRMLKGAQKECVHIDDVSTVAAENEGKTVHATAFAGTEEILTDDWFGQSANAIKLQRKVEYYQWTEQSHSETRDKVGGGQETITTYTYSKAWVGAPVNSSNFQDPDYKNSNSIIVEIPNQSLQAKDVSFGAYKLPERLVGQMSDWVNHDVELDQSIIADYNKQIAAIKPAGANQEYCHVSGNTIYLGASTNTPQIGDVRITFTKVLPSDVSIIAKIQGNTFVPFVHKNGYDLCTLRTGTVGMDQMFEQEHASNKTMSWILRILGFLLLYWGFKNIFNVLTALLKVLPFLGTIMGYGVNICAAILAFVLGIIVIALGWIWYRPVMGILLLAVACGTIWFFTKKGKNKAPAAEPAAEAPQEVKPE
ncbi:MAG: TMEM43 family protein [Bacteroidales bacterium]|nr:TMEM43 family protein [Bacteroidales bacterium]